MAKHRKWTKQDERREMKVVHKLMSENRSYLPDGFAEQIERDVTGPGKYAISRRVAAAFLSKPWPEMAENIARGDREQAVAVKEMAECVEQHAQAYKELARWMEAAAVRMQIALCGRDDFDGSKFVKGSRHV